MRSIVVYFSQTGGTRRIAEAIHAGIRQETKEAEIVPLKQVKARDLIAYDLIGLGAPIWFGADPANFHLFLESMPPLDGKHAFPFFTHGALPSGFMQDVVPVLLEKGLTVVGFNDWYGAGTLPHFPKPYFTDGHPDGIDLREAEDFGREMAGRSRRILQGERDVVPTVPSGAEWEWIYGPRSQRTTVLADARKAVLEGRKINTDKCSHCGLCVEVCPMESIDFSMSPPGFRQNCVGCFFCEQVCPTGAIEADYEPLIRVHDKSLFEKLAPRLGEAEAAGRFRRLVPPDRIGWPHWCKQSGHPRVIPE